MRKVLFNAMFGAGLMALQLQPCSAQAVAEVLTPAQYFECQISAQRATIQGLEERFTLSAKNAGEAEKQAAGDLSRQRVTLAMYACGQQSAATLGAYAHRNAALLQTWLQANPQVKGRLDATTQRIAELSKQMPAVSPSARR